MNEDFAASLGEWTAFYALMGGAAVTLLGLLFVAVSLRLNIFHQAIVEDIRDLAAFTLGTFLIALGVAALALAPHPTTASLAVPLALTGLAALAWAVGVARVWVRLNVPMSRAGTNRGGIASLWRDLPKLLVICIPYVGLVIVAFLLWTHHPAALSGLAIVEAALLVLGTLSAWLLLSHAGSDAQGASDSS